MRDRVPLFNDRGRWAEVWPHRVALLTAGATLLLLVMGGLVTSKGAGLAVPDWPTSFGYNMFLFPWSRMVGGIFYEHSHRLIGSVVGLLTIALVLLLWTKEQRRWLRWLGAVALLAVVVQGVLGGLRVILVQTTLAIIHASFAHAFFALMVSLALLTSRGWKELPQKVLTAGARRLQRLSILTMGLIYVQLLLGAVLRHTGLRLDAHLLTAALVAIVILWLLRQIVRDHSDQPKLVRPVAILSGLLILQLALGLGSYLVRFTTLGASLASFAAIVTTAHMVIGALMLASGLVLTLRTSRLLATPVSEVSRAFIPAHPAGGSEEVPA
ncbi:MAG: COX15/CtaA family protein [candidate division NC10 bacterium]|nr:COX15/CtaA family protein [candidate division NC10 bacterium]